MIVTARGDRPVERNEKSYEVHVLAAFLLAVYPVLGIPLGGFADPLDDRVFAPSEPTTVSRSGWPMGWLHPCVGCLTPSVVPRAGDARSVRRGAARSR
jgi:hypothetical protein